MVARLDEIKDHRTLIQGFARFKTRFPEARLILVGDGDERGDIERSIDALGLIGSVKMLGSRMDVPEQLSSLDLYAFCTTEQEGFGIAMIEAMAAGVPIVATDIGPCREVLDDGRAGLLVAPGNPEALAAGLAQLWTEADLRARMTAQAWDLVNERFSVSVGAEQYGRLLGV
jgi:glycosyltransferase involved in cell wall biosynthesis